MSNLFGLGIQLDFRDNATSGMNRAYNTFNQMYQSVLNLDQGMQRVQSLSIVSSGLMQVGNGISSIGRSITNAFSGFVAEAGSLEKELQQLKFVSGKTGDEFIQLKNKAIETGIKTAFSPQEATQAMYELLSAGLSVENMYKSLDDTLNLVAVSGGEIDLSAGASLMANIIQKFNLDASESKMIVDQLAQATKVSNFHFADFSAFMNSLQSAPTTLKRPLEEFLALGGLLRNIGQAPAQAGNTINGFGRQLMILTRQLENKSKLSGRTLNQIKFNAMEELGLDQNTIWDAQGNLNSLVTIFESLVTQMANMTDKKKAVILQTLFGDQAKNVVVAIENATKEWLKYDEATGKYVATTKEGKKSYQAMIDVIKNSKGVTEQGAKEMLNTWWGINKLWEGTKQTFSALMGETVIPVLGKFIGFLTDVTNKILKFVQAHPRVAKFLGYGIGITGLLLLATGGIIKFIASIGLAVAGIGAFVFSLSALNVRLAGTGSAMTIASRLAGGFGAKLKSLLLTAGKMGLIFGGVALAWKTDFLGVRSVLTNFINGVVWAFNESTRISNLGINQFNTEIARLQSSNRFIDKFILALVKIKVFWMALVDAWSDNTLSDENFHKVRELGLLPLLSTILDIKGYITAFAQGFKEAWEDIAKTVVAVVGAIGSVVGPIIAKLYDFIFGVDDASKTVERDIDLTPWKNLGYALGIITAIIIAVKLAMFIASGVTLIWSGITAIAGGVTTLLSGAVTILAGAFTFLCSPIGIAIALAILLVGGLVLLYSKCEWFRNIVDSVATFIGTCIMWLWTNLLQPFGEWVLTVFSVYFQTAFTTIGGLMNVLYTTFSEVWESIKTIFNGIVDFITGVFTGNWQQAWEGVKNIFKGIVEGLVSIFKAPINAIINMVNGLIRGLNNFKIPDWVPAIGGKGINIPTIPQLNTGGYIEADGMAMLHQNEVVVNAPLTKRLGDFLEIQAKNSYNKNAVGNPTMSDTGTQNIDNKVVFNEGAIQINLENGNEQDAERLVKLIMDKIQKKQQLERIRNYQFR